jgi:exodeoxyribonuclease-1
VFIFYDTETAGLDKDFTQILQIALVFTDDKLNILSSKKIECRRSPWILPAPGALLTTGFAPDDLKNNKYSHFDMMREIDSWSRSQHWPVIFSGYNTLGYDEPVLAQDLRVNLLDPGLTVAGNNVNEGKNGRSDIMTVVKAVIAYMPGALKLETLNEFGSPSLSLMNVAAQNGVNLSFEDAHDAMNDIKATLGVAKVLQKAAPEVWDQMNALSTAEGVDEFLAKNKVFTHAQVAYGKAKGFVTTSAVDGVLFDLSVDPLNYMNKTPEELKTIMSQKNPHPFRLIDKTAQPVLMPMDLSEPVIPHNYDEKLYASRANAVKANAVFQKNLAEAREMMQLQSVPIKLPELMGREGIQDGVLRDRADAWKREFHAAPDWQARAALVDDFYTRFGDDIKKEEALRSIVNFAGRIIYENAPETLSAEKCDAMKRHIALRFLNPDPNVPYMTIPKARKELEKIEQERVAGRAHWKNVTDTQVRSLKLYYTALEKEYAPFIEKKADNSNQPPVPPGADAGPAAPKL